MSKKRCFICDTPINAMSARCITKDGYLVCAKDAGRIVPNHHANNFSISAKTSHFISSHFAEEIKNMLDAPVNSSYQENPSLYRTSLTKVTDKLDSAADKAEQKADTLQNAIDQIDKDNQEKVDVIKQQLKEAGVESLWGTKKEVKALPDIIDISGGEKILYAANAFVATNSVLAVCTNKRVIFLDHGMVYGSKATDIPLDVINGVSYSKGLMLGSIAVTNGATTVQIENMQPYSTEKLAEAIKKAAAKFKQKSSKPEPNNDLSQLKDLKQLLDEGIITEEEFTAKKKQILGI